ncbi:MAG: extracellular solute-binding protein [Caldilineaceae bacterium]
MYKRVVAPHDDVIASTGFDTSVFWPAIMQALSVDGKIYGIPNHGHYGTVVYYYNKDLYEASGADLPNIDWSSDDLVTGAMKVTNDRRPGASAPPKAPNIRPRICACLAASC